MFYIGIDPGLTTGLAVLDEDFGTTNGMQSEDPIVIQTQVDRDIQEIYNLGGKATIIVEDYTGGGYRTREAIHTLKLVGFFYYTNLYLDRRVVLRTNQQRLKGTSFVAGQDHIPSPHAQDALKHCYAYREDSK